MTELQKEFMLVCGRYKNLLNEWNKQQEELKKMQRELFEAHKQIQQQSQYCASLGAVMGHLVWKASRIPPVVDMLLSGVR